MTTIADRQSYVATDRPTNPCAADTVEGCAFDVLMDMGAVFTHLSRERVILATQALYEQRSGSHTMFTSVDRMLRGGATSMLRTKLLQQGWDLGCPEFDGKLKDGRVMIWRSASMPTRRGE